MTERTTTTAPKSRPKATAGRRAAGAPSEAGDRPGAAGGRAEAIAAPDAALQLELSFGYLFKQAHRAFTRALDKRLKPHGITLAQWYFLRELWQEEGITQRELSRRMDVSEPTTTVAIDLMEKAGLIERQRDPGQRNSINVRLTRKGKRLKNEVLHIARDVNVVATRDLAPGNLEALRESIVQMVETLNQEAKAEKARG
jgi:DNA-binding MarR family transcriptional regulator